MKKKYDIFISYRRREGADTAKHLRDVLTSKGYHVFFDTDSLRSGDFNTELLRVIEECSDFIVILTPGALDRCENENDWVRQEIVCALENNKNIVPVISSGFRFPEILPREIDALRYRNGVTASVEYFDALVEKLLTFLSVSPKRTVLKRRILPVVLGVLVAAAAVFGVWQGVSAVLRRGKQFPVTNAEKTLLEESVNFWAQNTGRLNDAYTGYNLVLDDILAYCNGKAGAKTKEALLQEIAFYSEQAKTDGKAVTDMTESLSNRLADVSAIRTADLTASSTAARELIDTAAKQMDNLAGRIGGDVGSTGTTANYAEILRQLTEMDAELWMINLNQVFAGVDETAVTSLLAERLPLFTALYSTGFRWTTDTNALKTRENTLYERMQQANMDLAALVGNLQQENESIAQQLEQAVTDAITPQADDEFLMLWVRMETAYGYGQPDYALQNVEAMLKKADGSIQVMMANAANGWYRLAKDRGYQGCCILMGYSDTAAPDALQIEDFIVEIDGAPVNSAATLAAALTDEPDAEHTFTVLRADENNGLQELTVDARGNTATVSAVALEYLKLK